MNRAQRLLVRDGLVRDLERAGTIRFWDRAARRQRLRLRFSRRLGALRDALDEKRADMRLVPSLLIGALLAALGAAAVFIAAEAVGALLAHHDVRLGRRLAHKVDRESYEGLVIAIVGAEVFFLAMFYATVGIVASTAYQSVPGEIRQLFVQERGSQLFTRSVVRALVLGILVLALATVGYAPYGISIVVLVGLAVFSVLSLVVLGTSLFNFFDLSSLSTPLPGRFARAAKVAIARDGIPDAARQQAAHRRAADTLRLYRQITTLLVERNSNETAAPRRVLRQVLSIGNWYLAVKPAIPTDSLWFERVPAHRNWLTLDHSRLGVALETRTGVQPDLVPDRLWVERELGARVQELLPLVVGGTDWPAAIELVDQTTNLIGQLAFRLQIDEARLLRSVLDRCLQDAVAQGSAYGESPTVEHEAGSRATFRLASAERSIVSVTSLWLGFIAACQTMTDERLTALWDQAVKNTSAPYSAGAPHETLKILEDIAAGISLEQRIEGRRISPPWWVHHYAARAMARQLTSEAGLMISDVERTIVSRVEALGLEGEADLAALMTFDALELVSKLETHLPTVESALGMLNTLRSEHVSDDRWPDTTVDASTVTALEHRLLRHLATVSVALAPDRHDNQRPDLFGQAYKVLFDATFKAILTGDQDLAKGLFAAVFYSADRARRRLIEDLKDEGLQTKFIFGTEPLVDLMELSGYALLLQELNGEGVWDDVRAIWDAVLASDSGEALAEQLTGVAKARESVFALTQGGMERTSRKMVLDAMLRNRGIVESRYWSPVVRAFAPDDLGSFEEVTDLFLVEFLLTIPGNDSLELSSRADSLRRSIQRERERSEDEDGADGNQDAPEGDAPSEDVEESDT